MNQKTRKQHYIPRFFLKSFKIPNEKGKEDKIWLYRQGQKEPKKVSISDVAAEVDFYSKPSDDEKPTVDDLITEYEQELSNIFKEISILPADSIIPASKISEILIHFAMRGAYMRDMFEVSMEKITPWIKTIMKYPVKMFYNSESPKHRVPKKIREEIIKIIQEENSQHPVDIPKSFPNILYYAIRENPDFFKTDIVKKHIDSLFMFQNPRKFIQETYRNALKKRAAINARFFIPNKKIEKLDKLTWKMIECSTNNVIVPDCIAIAKDRTGWQPYILSESETLNHVIMPISSNKLAVGSTSKNWKEIASCYHHNAIKNCFTIFLSNKIIENSETLLKNLGEHSRSNIRNQAHSVFEDAHKEFMYDDDISINDTKKVTKLKEIKSKNKHEYCISFWDCVNSKETSNKIVKEVNKIISDFLQYSSLHFPKHLLLNGIDHITFAYDINSAVNSFIKNMGIECQIHSDITESQNIEFKSLLILKDDTIKTQIFITGNFVDYIQSTDEKNYKTAIFLLSYGLSRIIYNSLVEEKFPGRVLIPNRDPYEGWLSIYTKTIIEIYCSIWMLKEKEQCSEIYAELSLEKLDDYINATHKAYKKYTSDNDHTQYFEVCAEHIYLFMEQIARLFAMRAGQIGPPNLNSSLYKRLEKLNLLKWATLFEKDLLFFANNLKNWKEYEEIYFLNRHFERLIFTTAGILPHQLENGSLYINTRFSQYFVKNTNVIN